MSTLGFQITKIGPYNIKDEKKILDALWLMAIPENRYKIFGDDENRVCILNYDFNEKKQEIFSNNFKGALELSRDLNKWESE